MIAEIDTALRELFVREMPIRKGEIEIAFELPKREWSAKLNKPTLNLYMFDIKENVELRGSKQTFREEHEDGTITLRRNPVRVDLHYLLTAWTKDIQDEHHLLSSALVTLLSQPVLPQDLMPESLKNHSFPVRIEIAQKDVMSNITDLWSTLDNEIRAGLRLTVTFSIDPYKAETRSMVRTTELHFLQLSNPELAASQGSQPKDNAAPSKTYFMINGRVTSDKFSPSVLKLVLNETGQETLPNEAGEFKFAGLQAGEYHLDILTNDRILKHQKIQVPSANYEIRV
jgi:hypothetical protein